MKIWRLPLMGLAVSVILLSGYGRPQEPPPPERSPTPIIVGDGSIHIRPQGVPFYGGQWVSINKKEYRTKNNMLVLGGVYLVGTLKPGDWSTPEDIQGIGTLLFGGGRVTFTIADSSRSETITIADDRSHRGITVRSLRGFAEYYEASDKVGTELKSRSGTWQIRRIEIRPGRGALPRVLTADDLNKLCRSKYRGGCGISIDIFHGGLPARGRGAGSAAGPSPESK